MDTANLANPSFVAPDGTGIVASIIKPKTNGDIVWFPLKRDVNTAVSTPASAQTATQPELLVATAAIEFNPEVSPDGRYLAYQSNESGRDEIYVKPFPRVSEGRWQVSTEGGTRPTWARNGRELFYVDLANAMTAVPVQTAMPTFSAGNPTRLFPTAYPTSLTAPRDYDVAPDGRRFLMVKADATRDRTTTPASMIVVQNWFEELKQHVPAK
jgi:Tol biopolymer transport system component